jgi:hypothetical protein
MARPFVPKRPARATLNYLNVLHDCYLLKTDSVQIRVGVFRHVVIEDNVHTLNVLNQYDETGDSPNSPKVHLGNRIQWLWTYNLKYF